MASEENLQDDMYTNNRVLTLSFTLISPSYVI